MQRLDPLVRDLPDPDRGRLRLTRWIEKLTSSETALAQLESVPLLGRTLALLLASSTEVCDILARNPEMGLSCLDLDTGYALAPVSRVREEAKRLTAHTVSYSHKLDRLRFLKDKHTVVLAMADVGGFVPPKEVWGGITALAEGLLVEAAHAVWHEHHQDWGMAEQFPLGIVAFGKLGGGELNYSSDVDLAFIVPDTTQEDVMRPLQKFCERFRASVSDRMGRGALYRVDLRLRPFGSQGPLVNRWGAAQNYYARHSEPWEHLALVRSRVIEGWTGFADEWDAMRDAVAFGSARGEWVLDNLQHLRVRTMELGGDDDLKRGRGGIRDVEFLVQVNQLFLGGKSVALRARHTLDVLAALDADRVLPPDEVAVLTEGYTLLRQIEHRCQLRGGLQTHALPSEAVERAFVAASLGSTRLDEFEARLVRTRDEVHEVYARRMPEVGRKASRPMSRPVETWVGRMPEPELYLGSLQENRDSLERMELLARRAPTLLADLPTSPSVTDEVMSGEILEPVSLDALGSAPDLVASARASWLRIACQWALDPSSHASRHLFTRARVLVERCAAGLDVAVLGLGSVANQELSWRSDIDVLVFAEEEDQAVELVRRLDELHAQGGFLKVDTRLRPDGRKGALATTLPRVERYAQGEMAPWERFAFSQAVSLAGGALELGRMRLVVARRLAQDERRELHHIYQRVVTERTDRKGRSRSLKLAEGGLNDLQWFVHLGEIARWPDGPPGAGELESRLAIHGDALLAAHRLLVSLRHGLGLLDPTNDLVPTDGAKLEMLGEIVGGDVEARFEGAKAVVREALSAYWPVFLAGG